MINFNPALRLLDSPTRIVFDSRLDYDENRAAKIVNVERTDGNGGLLKAMESSIFVSEINGDETDGDRRINAVIAYKQVFEGGETLVTEIAVIRIKDKKADIDQLKTLLNAGLTNALIAAIDLKEGNVGATLPVTYGLNEQKKESSFRGWAMAIMAIAAVPILIIAVWAIKKPATTDQVYLSRFAENPQAIASQVETTKQVLKNMGLDPGKSGDIGCLAQKQ